MSDPIISPICEFGPGKCDRPTAFGYEAMGGGWMPLCTVHAKVHQPRVLPVAEIIAREGKHRTAAEWTELHAKQWGVL